VLAGEGRKGCGGRGGGEGVGGEVGSCIPGEKEVPCIVMSYIKSKNWAGDWRGVKRVALAWRGRGEAGGDLLCVVHISVALLPVLEHLTPE
jgi:hypothetical protein